MRIISIASQKGGCGKTTTAINLASAIANHGKKILLVDLDPQAHASLGLNIQAQESIYNVLSNLTPKRLELPKIIVNIEKNFDLAPSNILLGIIEQELSDEIGRESRLHEELSKLQLPYDFILIDCPPNLGLLTINAIRASQEVIIPIETSRFSIIGTERLIEIIDLIKERLNHSVTHRIIITMFDSRLKHSFLTLENIRSKFSRNLCKTIIHINVKLKESIVNGNSVIAYDKYSRGAKDYFSLAKELISSVSQAKEEDKGFFSSEMLEMVKEKSKDFITTKFTLVAPQAQSVYLTGEFNNWSLAEEFKLTHANGVWQTKIPLRSGRYRYRYVVDGKWQEDPNSPILEKNPFGEFDSVIEINKK